MFAGGLWLQALTRGGGYERIAHPHATLLAGTLGNQLRHIDLARGITLLQHHTYVRSHIALSLAQQAGLAANHTLALSTQPSSAQTVVRQMGNASTAGLEQTISQDTLQKQLPAESSLRTLVNSKPSRPALYPPSCCDTSSGGGARGRQGQLPRGLRSETVYRLHPGGTCRHHISLISGAGDRFGMALVRGGASSGAVTRMLTYSMAPSFVAASAIIATRRRATTGCARRRRWVRSDAVDMAAGMAVARI